MYAKCRNKVPFTWYHCNLSHHQGIVIHWKFNKADQILTKSGCPHSTQQVHCSDGYARLGHRNACMRSHHPRLRQEEQTKRASPMFARLHAFISRKQLTERVEVSTKDTGVFTHHYAESKSNTWRDTAQEIIQTRISAAMCTAKSQYSPSRHAIPKQRTNDKTPDIIVSKKPAAKCMPDPAALDMNKQSKPLARSHVRQKEKEYDL